MAARVTISIVGRAYEISCDEGQETVVLDLAKEVDRRASDLMRSVGQVGDARLLAMVALLMVDEIADLRRRLGEGDHPGDSALASGIEVLARRVDAIADRLGSA